MRLSFYRSRSCSQPIPPYDIIVKKTGETQLLDRLSDPFDADYFKKLQEDTSLFKLTYRGNLLLTTREGQDTYYKKILEQSKEDS